MKSKTLILSLLVLLFVGFMAVMPPVSSNASDDSKAPLPDRVLGQKDAPITITEYASFTCSHCSSVNNKVMPIIKKRYIDTGKVKLIYRDYPMDGISLRAAALARCLPENKYYSFVNIVHKNFRNWIKTPQPVETITQYAVMSGLDSDKAVECMEDTKLMDALIAVRTVGTEKYKIDSTPTFIFNDGEDKLIGAQPLQNFIDKIEELLAKKQKQT